MRADSFEFAAAAQWRFPAFAVALGRSYFQRLLAAKPYLAEIARGAGGEPGALCPPRPARPSPADAAARAAAEAALAGAAAAASGGGGGAALLEASLRSTQFACIFLATKVADQVHAFGLLRFVLSALTGQR